MSKKSTPVPTASNDDIALFLGVGDDTRRAILRRFGLPKRRRHAWSEIWVGLGLEPEQPEELWEHLTLGPKRTNQLWDAARAAEEIGVVADTVNGYYARGAFPDGFPRPLVDHRRKTRLWLPSMSAPTSNLRSSATSRVAFGGAGTMRQRLPPPWRGPGRSSRCRPLNRIARAESHQSASYPAAAK